ncbi:MAG TPA: hypothetical protein VHN37_14345 [Actinomycetota bacterium]|nr:hypothetical protein [Actinomycetota bacterium]
MDALRWYLEPFQTGAYEPGSIPLQIYTEPAGDDSDRVDFVYVRNLEERFRGSLPGTLDWLFWDVHDLVSVWVRDFLLVHSGAVTIGDRAVLLPAEMDTGKSTLVTALLHAGAGYLSDELGAIDPVTRRVYPYPKRITLDDETLQFFPGLEERLSDRTGAMAVLRQRYVRPEDCGASIAGPAPLGALVFPTADREGPPRLEEVAAAESAWLLAANARNLYRYGDRGVLLLGEMCAGARAYRLSGGTPRERADLLMEQLG